MQFTTILLTTMAALAAASPASTWKVSGPEPPKDFSACARTCVGNMYHEANIKMGCSSPLQAGCVCKKQNFMFGLRDCTKQSCKNPQDLAKMMDWYKKGLCAGM